MKLFLFLFTILSEFIIEFNTPIIKLKEFNEFNFINYSLQCKNENNFDYLFNFFNL